MSYERGDSQQDTTPEFERVIRMSGSSQRSSASIETFRERAAHPHQHTKAVADQLARTAGHVSSVKRMVQEGRPCPEVLIQLAAVRAAIDRASKLVLEDHVESCLRGAASNGMADEEWARLKSALDTFIR